MAALDRPGGPREALDSASLKAKRMPLGVLRSAKVRHRVHQGLSPPPQAGRPPTWGVERCKIGDFARLQRGCQSHWKQAQWLGGSSGVSTAAQSQWLPPRELGVAGGGPTTAAVSTCTRTWRGCGLPLRLGVESHGTRHFGTALEAALEPLKASQVAQ